MAHRITCLERHTGHRHQNLPVTFKPHHWCRAKLIMNNLAAVGHHGLALCEPVHIQTPALENIFHMIQHPPVKHHLSPENITQGSFRNVILRRAEAAGCQHYVSL